MKVGLDDEINAFYYNRNCIGHAQYYYYAYYNVKELCYHII